MNSAIASGLENSPHLKAFEKMIDSRFKNIDLSVMLIYLMDVVNADALPILAEQFDLLGVNGWQFATTEQQKRDMLKRAIELHRVKGTVAGIKIGLQLVGFQNTIVLEGVGLYYNGEYDYDGEIQYSSEGWFNFAVDSEPAWNVLVNSALIDKATAVIEEFKNIRSRFVRFTLLIQPEDQTGFAEETILNVVNGTQESQIIF